jgi:hypothetical protein
MKSVNDSLLNAPKDFAIVQCISADCAMGITSDGREIPCLALTLRKKYPLMSDYCKSFNPSVGKALIYRGPDDRIIFNLVTKSNYYGKPTYDTMFNALLELKSTALQTSEFRLAIPKLGSGLDDLAWVRVSKMIGYVFYESGIEVVLYNPEGLVGRRPHTMIMDEVL